MPSDFTKEYKNYIESETPDLWSRIEAGIEAEEKSQAEKSGATEVITFDDQTYVNQTKNKKIIRWGVFAKRAGSLAAAIALVFVAYGFVKTMSKGGMQSAPAASESAAPMADSAAVYEAEEAPAAEAADDDMTDSAVASSYDMAETAEAPAMEAEAEEAMADSAPMADNAKAAASNGSESYLAPEADVKRKLSKDDLKRALGLKSEDEAKEDIIDADVEAYSKYKLVTIEELAEAEQSEGDIRYEYGLVFAQGDNTVRCLVTKEYASDIEADSSLRLVEGQAYDIEVIRREYVIAGDGYDCVLVNIEGSR